MNNYAPTIKERLPARLVFEHYGIHVNADGFCCCPFHGEKTASCKVYPGERGWHCFGCHAGGDVIDFAQKYFGLDFRAAAARLNDDFGLGLPIGKTLSRAEQAEANRRSMELKRKASERKRKREELEARWNKALEDFTACDIIKQNCAPVSPSSGYYDAFVYACLNVDRLWFELKEAEMAIFAFDQEEKSQKTQKEV